MLRQGEGEPLVLLHGITGSERMWRHVVPLLAADHDVIAPTALGHRGGAPLPGGPIDLDDVVDDVERTLDRLEIGDAHLAGNSMGGWVALELARRGRARSVCALSPAGAWDTDWKDKQRVFGLLQASARDSRRSRGLLPFLARSDRFRRWAMRAAAVHGERVSRADFIAGADDMIGCTAIGDLLSSSAQLSPLDPVPCPITLAWSAKDHLFPVDTYGVLAQTLIPGASFLVLPDVGHVPMFDDPHLVAKTILAATTSEMSAPI
jgi:pimeloyl-ACP methyl ester carboxylesterase